MLILSRRTGETIHVASQTGDILITVSEVRGGRVRLSIDAPRSVRVVRSEILEVIKGSTDLEECSIEDHSPQVAEPPVQTSQVALDSPSFSG
jgi:carbon storage regulator CsrA